MTRRKRAQPDEVLPEEEHATTPPVPQQAPAEMLIAAEELISNAYHYNPTPEWKEAAKLWQAQYDGWARRD